jgi:hypothetical protein
MHFKESKLLNSARKPLKSCSKVCYFICFDWQKELQKTQIDNPLNISGLIFQNGIAFAWNFKMSPALVEYQPSPYKYYK